MAYRHFPISLVFLAAAAGTGSMIVVIGVLLALAAGTASACYFAFRPAGPPAPGRPSSPAKKPASPSAAPSDDSSAEPDTALAASESAEPGATLPPLVAARKLVRASKGPFADTRRHPRTEFLGSAAATIYPYDSRQTSVPVQCLVDTRDLSCNGIGIGHTQQLYPSQMIIISALGKLFVAEIRWCHRIDSDYYIAGCRLVKAAS
jgi:hypothetical protein